MSDAAKTGAMRAALRLKFPPGRYALFEEINRATGYTSARYADAIAVNLWPSDGLGMHGFELKASRADCKKELADLDKHHAFARFCETWTLVAYDRRVTDGLSLPDHWGVWHYDADTHGFVRSKAPTRNCAPEPWSRAFMVSLMRAAQKAMPSAEYVARAVAEACRDARVRTSAQMRSTHDALDQKNKRILKLESRLRELGVNPWDV